MGEYTFSMKRPPSRTRAPSPAHRTGFARRAPTSVLVALSVVAGACDSPKPSGPSTAAAPAATATRVPFDEGAARAMLLRHLQALVRADLNGLQADLFPRNAQTMAACGKMRLATTRSFHYAIGDEAPVAAPSVTGVRLQNVRAQDDFWLADYVADGTALSGTEAFVFENGRWWIKCRL